MTVTVRKTARKKTPETKTVSETKTKKQVNPQKKQKRPPKPVFDGGTRNEDGLLTEIPGDWNPKDFKPLTKKDFASADLYLEFSADRMEERGLAMIDRAKKQRERAEHLRKFGDPKKVKKAQKLAKLREQMASLASELEGEGFDLDSFLSD